MSIGSENNSVGLVSLIGTGAQGATTWLNGGNIQVGDFGDGTFSLGGISSLTNNGETTLGFLSGSQGTVAIDGTTTPGDTSWMNVLDFIVGEPGSGILTVMNAGRLTCEDGIIGLTALASGEAIIDRPDSEWSIDNDLIVGLSGTGVLNVVDGGLVSATNGFPANG